MSMHGLKLANLKQKLMILLDFLGENDRLSLVSFNSTGQRLCNLMRITDSNKSFLISKIQGLSISPGTNITSGMNLAFKTLKGRRYTNLVTSIFLLSDGQDRNAKKEVKRLLDKIVPTEQFSIHSFGFGKDHDAKLMNSISELKGGSFNYIENINQIDEFFVGALGGLFSVVAQEVEINVVINLQNPQVKEFFNDALISKTFGTMWNVVQQGLSYKIKINQLFSGVSKDFIFELTVPPKIVSQINDQARNAEIITADLVAIPFSVVSSTKVAKDSKLTLTLFTNQETVAVDSEINHAVEFNYLRVQASEAISSAIQSIDAQQFQTSQKILTNMIERLDNVHPNNISKVQLIKNDLSNCLGPSISKQSMIATMSGNINQTVYSSNQANTYQNQAQSSIIQQLKQLKLSYQDNTLQ